MQFIKKRKVPKPDVLHEKKEMKPKTARIIFMVLAVFLLISAPLGFLMGKQASVNAMNNRTAIKTIQKTLRGESQQEFDSSLALRFLASFIPLYMNKSNSSEDQTKRNEQLEEYYTSLIPMEEEGNSTQTLKDQTFYHFKKDSGRMIAQYVVHYTVSYPVEKEKMVQRKEGKKTIAEKQSYTDQEETDKTVLLNIPLIQKDQQFKVTGLPYYTSVPELVAKKVAEKKADFDTYKKLSEDESESVTTFLKEFYTYYTSGDKKQVTYLMEKPEVAPTGYEISDSEPSVYKDKGSYLVTDTVTLKEKETKNTHRESFTFRITKKGDNFYIKQFSHDLGGIKK
ncbi:MAG: conjugal transfer protein [Enterococcus sp.]